MVDELDIAPSELGTKTYWDSRYEQELHNFEECGDEGEIWFGRSAEKRIIDFVKANVSTAAKILDLGCGNGSVLRRLRKHGYRNLTGVDYCPAAIELANRISKEEDYEVNISFKVLDVLSTSTNSTLDLYDVVLDKGTWDAMSLSNDRKSRLLTYKSFVARSLSPLGQFVIFSCNFTKEELLQMFEDGGCMKFQTEIPAAHSITFGGKQGVTSTGVVFKLS